MTLIDGGEGDGLAMMTLEKTSYAMRIFRRRVCTALILVAVACLHTGCFPVRTQEERYQSAIFVVSLVKKYHLANKSLPSSWDDLEKVDMESGNGFFSWPSGRQFVEDRIRVDFSMSMGSVIERPEDYIRSRGVTYSFRSELLNFADHLKKSR